MAYANIAPQSGFHINKRNKQKEEGKIFKNMAKTCSGAVFSSEFATIHRTIVVDAAMINRQLRHYLRFKNRNNSENF